MVVHALPAQPTPFVGRTQELAEVIALLDNPDCRLLTLVGPGGIGKTRLALEAATRLFNRERAATAFPDRVYFVALQPLTAPEFILSALAEAVGVQFYPGAEPLLQLIDFLCPQAALLILDNFEHLLEGAGIVSEILSGAPSVKVLATSRETLNLQEEWLYQVKGLRFPQSERDAEWERYSAVRLFAQSAQRVRSDFSLDGDKHAVLQICERVEGLPLALEMTAAWLKRLPIHEIVRELERGLDILESPARNIPARHRSMRAVFEHSWHLLTDSERDVFKKLSVFRGSFNREAAEAVAGASLGTLSALVDKSLLRVDEDGRYDLHELLRQCAEEQLDASTVTSYRVHDLHCDYFTSFLTQRNDAIMHLRKKSVMDELSTELDNVRSAWEWAVDHRDGQGLLKIGAPLRRFYVHRSLATEGREVFGKAVANLRQRSSNGLEIGVTRFNMAWCSQAVGRYEEARALHEANLAEASLINLNHPDLIAVTLIRLSDIWAQLGDYDRARQFGQQAVDRLAAVESANDFALLYLAKTMRLLGDYQAARTLILEAIASSIKFDRPPALAEGRAELGYLELSQHAYQEARRIFIENATFARDIDNRYATVESLTGLGMAHLELGDYAESRACFSEAIATGMEWNLVGLVLDALTGTADLLIRQRNREFALQLLAFVLEHPAADYQAKQRTKLLLAQVGAQLSSEAVAANLELAKTLRLEAVVQTLLTQQLATTSASPTVPGQEPDLLTERELEILHLMADGLTNREIGERLFLAASTVKWYTLEIYSKLDVANRTQAVTRARALKLLA